MEINMEWGVARFMPPGTKVTLASIKLDRGGYTDWGRYFGVGAKLFCASTEHQDHMMYFRAYDRPAATAKLKKLGLRIIRG